MHPQGIEGLPSIPAMTSDAERECYYRLAKKGALLGEIVELGPWLGASTAYIAAGVRDACLDAGMKRKVQVYDRFKLNKEHLRKAKGHDLSTGPCLDVFKTNLGPLLDYVETHSGEIADLEWGGESISVLICDAPKRVPQISSVLTKFRKALQPGSIMAWQDFCHFPSYEIPACLYRLRDHLEFVEAVVPGTTMVFRVKSRWNRSEVSMAALDLGAWKVDEIAEAWAFWFANGVPKEKAALFHCGAAMFLCDIGEPDFAVQLLSVIYSEESDEIVKKWRYLKDARPDFLARYAPLFQYLERQGVFEKEAA